MTLPVFAQRMTKMMAEGGWTHRQLAAKVGVSPASIHQWKVGVNEPGVSNLAALCRALGISADYLLGLEHLDRETEQEQERQLMEQREVLRRALAVADALIAEE